MNKRDRRKTTRLIALVFWVVIAILAMSQRGKLEKNPYIYSIVVITFVGYIIYQNIYRLPKLKSKKKDVRKMNLEKTLEIKDLYKPKINPKDVPGDLQKFIPIVTRWGVKNKILRNHLYESSSETKLFELKEIESQIDSIMEWIGNSNEQTPEQTAFRLTLDAYHELGLFTWEKNMSITKNKTH